MRAFHDSRDKKYRLPYGALEFGKSVDLAVDVLDTADASVFLRTWIDGEGEALYEMAAAPGVCGRYEIVFTPRAPGVVWYHFVIVSPDGTTKRYGAREGCRGGKGELRDWEPPSFQLTVCAPRADGDAGDDDAVERGDLAGPLGDAVIGYVRDELTARDLAEAIEAYRENNVESSFRRALGQLAAYDRVRLFSAFADVPNTAKGRFWCASLVQALLPIAPAALLVPAFSDSVADDLFDADCKAIVENALDLRCIFSRGVEGFDFRTRTVFAANDDVFGFWIYGDEGTAVCVLVNASLHDAHDVDVPMRGEAVSEVIGGFDVPAIEGADGCAYAHVRIHQLGSAALYFHPRMRMQLSMKPGIGVLAHITSLPAGDSQAGGARQHPATLGAPARAFVDWLAEEGVRYWQVLPVNPTDDYGSPYAGISAFAGNTQLMEGNAERIAADLFEPEDVDGYRLFCGHQADWLEPYASFMAIRQKIGEGKMWQDWPERYRRFDPALVEGDPDLRECAESWRRRQYAFERQWRDLRRYANGRGVQIIGDMPLYVSIDSADAWANPGMFQLGPDGRPTVVAGCPPDAFAANGQVWGNPVYDWDALRASGYAWWLRRLERAFELYDIVRLDHFIGFARYFSIPKGEGASMGRYCPGPGSDLFRRAFEEFGPLPVIAEDLGIITPAVRALVAVCGFPGMDVVQFADDGDPLSGYRPHLEKVVYTGTHDNQTLVGYASARYPLLDARATAAELMGKVMGCGAPVVIVPLQDVLGLGDEARMNVPGTSGGNWVWQAMSGDFARPLENWRTLCDARRRQMPE